MDTVGQAKKNNPCLAVDRILEIKRRNLLLDDKIFSKYGSGNSLKIKDDSYINLLKQNSEKIEDMGFKIMDLEEEKGLELIFPKEQEELTIEKRMEILKERKKELYIALGLEKEKSQTQKLCEETIEEQRDTMGKIAIKNEIDRQKEEAEQKKQK